MSTPLLEVKNLRTELATDQGPVYPCDGVNLVVRAGEAVGLVGESGSGKSMTALSIMGLVPDPPGKVVGGEVLLNGRNILGLNKKQLAGVRGKDMAMIFQDPSTYLNPVMTVGDQVGEAIRQHQPDVNVRQGVNEVLDLVGLATRANIASRYPHELSGGMRQRVLIASALACRPSLLIADEPTTALDVTIQAQILALLSSIQRELGMGLLFISHDIGVIGNLCDRLYVMYAGQVVEENTTAQFLARPHHPYGLGLLQSVLSVDEGSDEYYAIGGGVPSLADPPSGCRFHPRCEFRQDRLCSDTVPPLIQVSSGVAACHYVKEIEEGIILPRSDMSGVAGGENRKVSGP